MNKILNVITRNKLKFVIIITLLIISYKNPHYFFPDNSNKIAVLRLKGSIDDTRNEISFDNVKNQIDGAFKIKNLSSLFLSINCPGGSPVQSELITSYIMELSKKNKVPVYSFIEDMGTSGGYWLALAGEKIFASNNSIVGSIGVINRNFGFPEMMKKLGIERRVYSSGKNKNKLDPFLPRNEENEKLIEEIIQDMHNNFINFVKLRRGNRLNSKEHNLFTGQYWTGKQAAKLGLIDDIYTINSYINKNVDKKTKIIYIKKRKSFFEALLGMSNITINISENLVNQLKKTFNNQYSYDLR